MAAGAIARVLLGLAVKGAKKTSKKAVKKPKAGKELKLSAADDAKAAAYWKKRHPKTGKKVVAKPRKRGGAPGMEPRVKTESGAIKRLTPKQSRRLTKADLADIKKTAKMPTKRKMVGRTKTPVVTRGDVAAAAVAGAGAGAYWKDRNPRTGKKKTKLKRRSKSYMTRQFKDGTSEPYKVIKGSQFINQK